MADLKNDFVEFEKAFRELKTELYMKRNEVTKLKSELEEAHHEIHNLKYSLETLKKTSEENKITMDMFMKRTQDYELKFYEKRDALARLDLQYKMECSKNNILREDFQKSFFEKSQLIRKIDALEEQRKRDLLYSNDISQKLMVLKNMMGTIKNDLQNVKEEHQLVSSLSEKVDLVQESTQKCQELTDKIGCLKEKSQIFEEQSVKYKAKSEMLESMISNNIRIQEEENLEARVILNQYKKMIAHNKEKIEIKNDIINTLNGNLNQEKKINKKLIDDNDKKNKYILLLENKINEMETKIGVTILRDSELPQPAQNLQLDASVMCIKVEPDAIIEINDSPN